MVKRVQRGGGTFYGTWIVAGCFLLLFLFAGPGFYSFSIFIKPLEDDFGWTRSAISLAMSLYMVVQGLVGPLVGQATQAYGPKKVMTVSALLSGAGFILVSLTESLWYFYGSYILLSIAIAGIGIIPVSSLLTRWFVRRRGTATGFAMLGISAGGLIMAPLAGSIIAEFGWRTCFVFLGVLVWLLGLPVTLLLIKASPAELGLRPDGDGTEDGQPAGAVTARHAGSAAAADWPLRDAVRSREFLWIAVTFFLAPLAQMGMLQHHVPLIVEAGVSETMAAAGLGLTAGLGGLGKLSFGRISETVPFRYVLMLCFGLQALGVLILFTAYTQLMVWAYVALFGFAMGGVVVLVPLTVAHFFGLASFGVIMGSLSLILALGNASGALLSGVIYDLLGSYDSAMVTYMCLYVAAIFSIFLAGNPRAYSSGAMETVPNR